MDIPALSMTLAQTQTISDVGVAMLSKSLDSMKTSGDAMMDMMKSSMELSVNPAIGANLDLYA
ncbi:putative motility protein YjfB-like [Kineothrix alysoides]|uniref:Putative motility protein YjfB-like n=1 Tax=Kineothrix alysoides TaxID=1469948 RepID=A0A4R1R2A7_9FIRM|nr:YjfB family protein [Kineothrix alysoides]TCL59491.1 putative motility protein YjfB-like [Kineothrix alysoides]